MGEFHAESEREKDRMQRALLTSMKNDNFKDFKKLLDNAWKKYQIDVNHLYEDSENNTLLHIACSTTNKAPHIKHLLLFDIEVNLLNGRGEAPIHLAVSSSDLDTVTALVQHSDTNILQPNATGQTAFHLAAQRRRPDFMKLLQERLASDIEKSKKKVLPRLKYYDPVDDMYRLTMLPEMRFYTDGSLFSLLLRRDYEAFKSKANSVNIQCDGKTKYTYLQYACMYDLTEFVELLLHLNANPNETGEKDKRTPIIIAANRGHHNIVKLLLDTGVIKYDLMDGENILNHTMHGLCFSKNCGQDDRGQIDHAKCLQLILNHVPDSQLNVDLRDTSGNTPLYYAILYDNRDMIVSLLERGAYIGAQNSSGQMLIKLMRPATLEFFLNSSMYTKSSSNRNRTITFSYDLLTCTEQLNHKQSHETKLLVALSEKNALKPLLKHPSLLIYLDFKWHVMKKLYYTNLIFYTLFISNFSIYLSAPPDSVFSYILLTLNLIISLKTAMKFIIYVTNQQYKYFIDPENWIEITLAITIYIILFMQSPEGRVPLAVAAILLSYVELMLQILNHPRTIVHIEMFKAVAWDSMKFLTSYLLLILAFALSFFVLFTNTNNEINFTNNESNFSNKNCQLSTDIQYAILNTSLILMGEYELSNTLMKREHTRSTIHLIFILLFIFLVPVVFFNLMTAITVNDIRAIRKDAELVSHVARAKSIVHTEEIIFTFSSFLDKLANYYDRLLRRKSGSRTHEYIRKKQHYYTNYFGASHPSRQIIYNIDSEDRDTCIVVPGKGYHPAGKISKVNQVVPSGTLKFSVFPPTARSVRERLSAELSKDVNADLHH